MSRNEELDFTGSISKLINLNLTIQGLNKSLEATCGLSIVQWSVLNALLKMPAVAPQILARALNITPGTLSQSLSRLSKKHFLFICNDPHDARKKMISLTRSGKDALKAAEREYRSIFSGINSICSGIDLVDGFLKNTAKMRVATASTDQPGEPGMHRANPNFVHSKET